MTPINFNYVTTKSISLTEDDGAEKNYSVLVIDEERNKEYWATRDNLIEKLSSVDPESIECISFVGELSKVLTPALVDLIQEENLPGASDLTLLGVPLHLLASEGDDYSHKKIILSGGHAIDL